MADKAVKIALPPVSGWTLGTGLEAYGGGIIRLTEWGRTIFSDAFNNSSLDANFTVVGTNVTETTELQCNKNFFSNTSAAYYNTTLPDGLTDAWRIKFKVRLASYTSGIFSIANLYHKSTPPAAQGTNLNYLRSPGFYYGTSTTNVRLIRNVGPEQTTTFYTNSAGYIIYTPAQNWGTVTAGQFYYLLYTYADGLITIGLYSDEACTTLVTATAPMHRKNFQPPASTNFYAVIGSCDNDQGVGDVRCAGFWHYGRYVTTSPEAEMTSWLALPAGTLNGTTSLDIVENVLGGASTIKYQYATNSGAYNGSWVTKATMEAALRSTVITDTTNSLRIKIQFISNGTQAGEVAIASYVDETVTIPGAPDYPAESDVRFGVDFDNAAKTGSAHIPSPDDVRSGVGVDATTGNMTLPPVNKVKLDTQYGTNGVEFTGTLVAPVYDGTKYASAGSSPQLFADSDGKSAVITAMRPRALAPATAMIPGGVDPLATTNTDLVQCPTGEQYLVTVTCTNRSATPSTIRVAVIPYSEVLANKHYRLYDVTCNQEDPIVIENIPLSAGDKIVVYTTNATMTFGYTGVRNY